MAASELQLPNDLVAFLQLGGRLEYPPPDCEAGAVELYSLAELRVEMFQACCAGFSVGESDPNLDHPGCYRVPGVDLIKYCTGDYEPKGLLIWFPEERCYGVHDSSHDLIFVFPRDVTWSIIETAAHRFINAQWGFEGIDKAEAELLVPWPKYPFGR